MCSPQVATAALQVGTGIYSASQTREAGKSSEAYYQQLAANNEDAAKRTAEAADAESKSVKAASVRQITFLQDSAGRKAVALRTNTKSIIASQKAVMAASGVDSSSGTATDVVADTFTKGNNDELALRLTADMQANETQHEVADTVATIYRNSANKQKDLRTQGAGYMQAGANEREAANTRSFTTLLNTATTVAKGWYDWSKTSVGAPKANLPKYGELKQAFF